MDSFSSTLLGRLRSHYPDLEDYFQILEENGRIKVVFGGNSTRGSQEVGSQEGRSQEEGSLGVSLG